MSLFRPLLVVSLCALAASGSRSFARAASGQRATIVTKVQKIAHPQYGPGVIRYPAVRAASEQATRAINRSLAQIREDNYDPREDPQSLTGMTFRVNHNGDGILSLTIRIESSGAYPIAWLEHRCYVIATGERILAKTLFDPAKLAALVARLDGELQKEIELAREGKLPKLDPACRDSPLAGHFSVEHLESFKVGLAGITFFYPYDLPHAAQACEPPGHFFLSYGQLVPFLLSDGPLAGVIRAAPSALGRHQNAGKPALQRK